MSFALLAMTVVPPMNKKNILIFCHHHATQFVDVCNQYAGFFDRTRYHVTVAFLCGPPDEAVRQRTDADDIIFLDQSKRSVRGFKLGILWKMFCLARKRRFEVVICQRYKPFYLFMWIEKWVRIPVLIFVAHDLQTLSSKIRCLMIRLLARRNMYFVGVSDAMREVMRAALGRSVPASHIVTLYNATDITALESGFYTRFVAREKMKLPAEAFVFGTFGRLEANKDQESLIRAFAMLSEACPDAVLAIAGEGSQAAALQALSVNLGVDKRVYFTGFLEEGWRCLPALDVFLLTTRIKESFGRALSEAMTARLPVIGVRTGGIPEVVGDAGPVVTPGDVEALAAAMQSYYQMTPETRREWGERGYQRVRDQFSLPRFYETFRQMVPCDP